jgi:osmotically-inducible protein OsmY
MKIPLKHKQTLADFVITSQILGALKVNPQIQVNEVEVSTSKGCVTLKGILQWEFQEEIVKGLAGNMIGVRKVKSFLAINPAASNSTFWSYSAN